MLTRDSPASINRQLAGKHTAVLLVNAPLPDQKAAHERAGRRRAEAAARARQLAQQRRRSESEAQRKAASETAAEAAARAYEEAAAAQASGPSPLLFEHQLPLTHAPNRHP